MRSLLIVLFLVTAIIVLLPVMLFELVFRQFNREASEIHCQYIARTVMKVIDFLAGMQLTVKGSENIPKDEAVLYVPNHRGAFDYTSVVTTLPVPVFFVGKADFLKIPFFGVWVYLVGTLLLKRESLKEGLKVVLDAIEKVKAGKSVIIFPEGTRNKGDILEPAKFKEGSFKIAVKSGCRIIPVAITGTREIFERQAPIVKSGKVTLAFGEPIDPKTLAPEDVKRLGAYTREKIIEMLKKEADQ